MIPQKRMECLHELSIVFEWHKRFKEGRESVRDGEWCGKSIHQNWCGKSSGVGSQVRKSIHQNWVPTGQTVNKEYYVEVFREFR